MICTPNKYCSGEQIEKNKMGGACIMCGEMIDAYRILVWRPEGRSQLGKPRLRWEDNIKMYLEEDGWGHGLV